MTIKTASINLHTFVFHKSQKSLWNHYQTFKFGLCPLRVHFCKKDVKNRQPEPLLWVDLGRPKNRRLAGGQKTGSVSTLCPLLKESKFSQLIRHYARYYLVFTEYKQSIQKTAQALSTKTCAAILQNRLDSF